jgi:hypothetical protein
LGVAMWVILHVCETNAIARHTSTRPFEYSMTL